MRRVPTFAALPLLTALLLPSPADAQASANAGHPDQEGCWCGYQTNAPRSYVIRGKGSDSGQKEAAADMLREWNRYVDLFTPSVDLTQSLGSRNGVNEVNLFITSAESETIYGVSVEPKAFGIAVIYPDEGFGHFNECSGFKTTDCGPFTETDVVVNADYSAGWTGDWFAKGNDKGGGAALVQTTVLHEVGHTLGLHHVFNVAFDALYGNSFSTMNYLNDDVGKFVTRMDSKTVRAQYPGAARSFVDLAITPFVYGNGQYDQEYAALSKSSVLTGDRLTVSNWLVQNVGSRKAGAFRVTFYLFPAGSRPYPEPSDRALGSADFGEGADVDAEREMSGTPLVVPAGVPAGDYWVGAIVTVGGQEDSPWSAGKPNNNRMVIGHSFSTLRVLPGIGPTLLGAEFLFTPAQPQAGQTVTFADVSRGSPTSWLWDFDDPGSGHANRSADPDPSHAFVSAGAHVVSLAVKDGKAESTTSRTLFVAPTFGNGGTTATPVLPVVIDLPGRFSTELTIANSGSDDATVRLRYTASPRFGGQGTGAIPPLPVKAGRQVVVANAVDYLRSKGLPIPAGDQGGSLRLEFEGLSSTGAAYGLARTTAPIAGVGRAGVSCAGVDARAAYNERVAVFGLRENAYDRSHLGLVNTSTTSPVTLTVDVVRGDGKESARLAPVTLQPGEWRQLDRVLSLAGPSFTEGWAVVDPGTSTVPFLAYGVVNDNGTNDGSYVAAIPDSKVEASLVLPAVVEIGDRYSSELILTNVANVKTEAIVEFVESLANPGGLPTGTFSFFLGPFEQVIVPEIVDTLRRQKPGAFPLPKGGAYTGTLSVTFSPGTPGSTAMTPGLAGVRTSSPSSVTPGRLGVFSPGEGIQKSARDAFVYGLQQNASTRSNLAIVNAVTMGPPIKVRLEIVDADTGVVAATRTLSPLAALEWRQIDRVLELYAPGVTNAFVHLSVVEGDSRFFAYAVLNDGARPGQGTGDGSYVPMVVNQ